MPSRREFLRHAVCASGTVLGYGLIGPFRGVFAGQQREVEGIPFCWCPPGHFVMGSPPGERGRRPDEDQVEVVLTEGFWIGTYEVTQSQWRRTAGAYPARAPSTEFGIGDDFPVYWINFHEAESFCAKLNARARASGALPEGWEFRLPTEAQWEYACRAGTITATAFGETLSRELANFASVSPATPPSRGARRVGSYPANRWGICEMHGNVWEWCRDWYHPRLPGGSDPDLHEIRGARNRDGSYSRVRRGGAWIEPEWACRSACRLRYEPDRRSDHIGFRVGIVAT
jgi:formylglycine-generating enzyme required for sulfatase activity